MTPSRLLTVERLTLSFRTPSGRPARVINDVSLTIDRGEIHGLVGESGSGKSVTSRAIIGLIPRANVVELSGRILLEDQDLLSLTENQLREHVRGQRISMVFQDPMTALNPVMRVGKQIMNPLLRHTHLTRTQARAKAVRLLDSVGIPQAAERARAYPHELSGGQRQRVMIAIALTCDPELVIADEPTTALDVTVQAQILGLLETLRAERGLSGLLVSHDLGLITERCDRVSVMYGGRIVESGSAREVFRSPRHPYTHLLHSARPSLTNPQHTRLQTIPGGPPSLTALPPGCAFADRCPRRAPDCLRRVPDLLQVVDQPGHRVACFHPLDDAASLLAGATPPADDSAHRRRGAAPASSG